MTSEEQGSVGSRGFLILDRVKPPLEPGFLTEVVPEVHFDEPVPFPGGEETQCGMFALELRR